MPIPMTKVYYSIEDRSQTLLFSGMNQQMNSRLQPQQENQAPLQVTSPSMLINNYVLVSLKQTHL